MAKSTTPSTSRAALLAGAADVTADRGGPAPVADAATEAAEEGATTFPLPDPPPSTASLDGGTAAEPLPDPPPSTASLDGGTAAEPLPQVDTLLPDAGRPLLAQADAELTDTFARRRSPPLVGDRAMPLAPVAPYGHTTTAGDPAKVDPAFRRESMIDRLTRHPVAGVRQRALEAQAAIHHGAPDIGLKVRAALDTAREADGIR